MCSILPPRHFYLHHVTVVDVVIVVLRSIYTTAQKCSVVVVHLDIKTTAQESSVGDRVSPHPGGRTPPALKSKLTKRNPRTHALAHPASRLCTGAPGDV